MQVKDGVELKDLDIKMRPVLIEAEKIWKRHGRPEGVTVTSTADGVHSAGSLHPYGLAIDLRHRYFTQAEALDVTEELEEALMVDDDSNFQVIHESNHIHVEYDPQT